MSDIKFKGITEFQEKLQKVINEYPNETENELQFLGKKLKKSCQDKTKDRTKKKTGKLRRSYKLSQVNYSKSGNSYITLKNTAPHFHLIEKGHRVVSNGGNNNFTTKNNRVKSGKELGYVPGKHMLENSVTELDNEMPMLLETWIDSLLGGME